MKTNHNIHNFARFPGKNVRRWCVKFLIARRVFVQVFSDVRSATANAHTAAYELPARKDQWLPHAGRRKLLDKYKYRVGALTATVQAYVLSEP